MNYSCFKHFTYSSSMNSEMAEHGNSVCPTTPPVHYLQMSATMQNVRPAF